jgi:hypothetical protein
MKKLEPQTELPSVAGRRLKGSNAEFERSCLVLLKRLVEPPSNDPALIGVLCEAVRCVREYSDNMNESPDSMRAEVVSITAELERVKKESVSESIRANVAESTLRAFTKLILDALKLEKPENERDTVKLVLSRLTALEERGNHRLAWLVENGKRQGHGLQYLTFSPSEGMFTWVENVEDALQFSRRKDAEIACEECLDDCSIVEHSFLISVF